MDSLDKFIDALEQIEELKQQLAEKDKQILELQEQSIRDNQLYNEALAEKEKEIKKWKTKWCESEKKSLRLYEQNLNQNQDKISFCIEKLEHLRNVIDNETYYCYGDNNINIVINKKKFNEQIDNQIEELKKEIK